MQIFEKSGNLCYYTWGQNKAINQGLSTGLLTKCTNDMESFISKLKILLF